MKTVACKDMGVDCPWVGRAMTEDELLEQADQHAKKDHQMFWEETLSQMSRVERMEMMRPHIKEK